MQQLARVSDKGTVYTDDQVTGFLIAQTNQERWLFDQLDAGLNYKNDISPFVDYDKASPKIVHDASSVVPRSLTLAVRGDSPLNEQDFLSDIIRVRYQLKAPDGGWLEWLLGHFTLTPFDKDSYSGWEWNTIKSPDFGQLLVDSTFTTAFTVPAKTNYVTAIRSIVIGYGGKTTIPINIIATDKTLPASLSWEIGVPRLQAVNDLLQAINYFPAWFDETGTLTSSPIPDYNTVLPTFTFDTTQKFSTIMSPLQSRPDISKAYNIIIVIGEDARHTAIYARYENSNPSDPISTAKFHPKTSVVRDSKIADIPTAQARARTEAQAASRIFGKLSISSFPWAVSQNKDVYRFIYNSSTQGLQSDLYLETKWEHTCGAGKPTIHQFEKIIQ